MGASVWTFLRPHSGELHAVTQRAVSEFLSSAGRLPTDAEGYVRYAEVVVNLENRQAVQLLRVGFYQYRALIERYARLQSLPRDHGHRARGRVRRRAAHQAEGRRCQRGAQIREATP